MHTMSLACAISLSLRRLVLAAFLSVVAASASAAVFTVNSTNDNSDKNKGDGICADTNNDCTLRAALEEANALSGTDTIQFGIPGGGVHTITPGSALPTISTVMIIDGTSQPGYTGTPLIELDGTTVGGISGLTITAGSCTVKGLAINRFGNGITISTAGGNTIAGNFLGTNPAGTAAAGNSANGI